jgi:hypothetical protein
LEVDHISSLRYVVNILDGILILLVVLLWKTYLYLIKDLYLRNHPILGPVRGWIWWLTFFYLCS